MQDMPQTFHLRHIVANSDIAPASPTLAAAAAYPRMRGFTHR
jgi:hypothetical protein